ncbi:MAG TPA: hypothetical protein VH704_03020 [Casimicrobiaceae bacterium]|jgi:hypothetical protein|nr:hypothetical protein [Casimicrobiaceae bacterium]
MVALLAAGVSGVARADNDTNPFDGYWHQEFNSQPVDKSPSAWRQANPRGLSERELEALSENGASSVYSIDKPALSTVASDPTFRETHPNGLSTREFQTLSDSTIWRSTPASAGQTAVARSPSNDSLAARVMKRFHWATRTEPVTSN